MTPALKQHIRQLDLAHMLGGGNLFDEATEKGPACTTTVIAALGCQTLLSRVLLLELRCITLHKKHIATSLAIGTRLHTSRCSGICRVITNSWNIMHTHMHAIEEDINLKQLTGLIILGQALSSGPTSGQHLGTGMATFSCVRAQRTGRRLHKWNSWTCFFIACNFWFSTLARLYNGLRITRKVIPRTGTGERRVFALARYLLYCLLESEGVVVGDGEEGGERTRRCNSDRGIDERKLRIWRAKGAFGTVCCVMFRCSTMIIISWLPLS